MPNLTFDNLTSKVVNPINEDAVVAKFVQPKRRVRQIPSDRFINLYLSKQKLLTGQDLSTISTLAISLTGGYSKPGTRLIGSGLEDGFSAIAYIYPTTGGSATTATRVTIPAHRYEDAASNPNQVDLTVPSGQQTTGRSVNVYHHFSNGRLFLKVNLPDNEADQRFFSVFEGSFRENNASDPAGGLTGLMLQSAFTIAPDFQLLFIVNSTEVISWDAASLGPTRISIPTTEDSEDLVTARLRSRNLNLTARQAAALTVTK